MKIKNGLEQDSITGGKNTKKKIGALKRKTVPFLVVILVVTSALCYGQNLDCPSCIVGYWKMDETSGTLAHDSINGNHGGVFTDGDGVDPVWVPGIVGNALDFPGDAPDAVVIGDDPAYHFGTGDFALEAWIKYEGPTDGSVRYPAIMSKRPGPPGSDPIEGFCLCLSYWEGGTLGSLLMRIEDTNYVPCSTPVDDGNWHHVVVQRCQNQVQFYVDGTPDTPATSTKDATTDAGLTLGLDSSSYYDTEWEGLIDEVALYDCCLSPEIINWHYECGLDGEGYCEPCLDVTKKAIDPTTGGLVDSIEALVGTEVHFVITVCNCGASDLGAIEVVDYFPSNLEYVDSEASEPADESISGNQVTWEFSNLTLQPGDCFDIEVKAQVTSEGDDSNCVRVHAESQEGSISDGDCVAVTGAKSGICLGSALLTGILALGVVVLNRKKE